MKCRYCGRTDNLETARFIDEDGLEYDEPIDICRDCVEVAEERSRLRREWEYYHPGEPAPESELNPWTEYGAIE